MGGVRRRLKVLETKASDANKEWVIPIEVRVLFRTIERDQAREEGRELPLYDQEEVEHLRQNDLETVAGGGVVGQLRHDRGWQSEESQSLLDAWEEDSRRRVEAGKDLPREEWGTVWGVDDEDERKEKNVWTLD